MKRPYHCHLPLPEGIKCDRFSDGEILLTGPAGSVLLKTDLHLTLTGKLTPEDASELPAVEQQRFPTPEAAWFTALALVHGAEVLSPPVKSLLAEACEVLGEDSLVEVTHETLIPTLRAALSSWTRCRGLLRDAETKIEHLEQQMYLLKRGRRG